MYTLYRRWASPAGLRPWNPLPIAAATPEDCAIAWLGVVLKMKLCA